LRFSQASWLKLFSQREIRPKIARMRFFNDYSGVMHNITASQELEPSKQFPFIQASGISLISATSWGKTTNFCSPAELCALFIPSMRHIDSRLFPAQRILSINWRGGLEQNPYNRITDGRQFAEISHPRYCRDLITIHADCTRGRLFDVTQLSE
jgi:hypothetical protein